MDRRTIVAILLILGVVLITPRFFPAAPRPTPPPVALGDSSLRSLAAPAPPPPAAVAASPSRTLGVVELVPAQQPARVAETILIDDAASRLTLSITGASIASILLPGYQALDKSGRSVSLTSGDQGPLVSFRLLTGRDTIALSTIPFVATRSGNAVTFAGQVGTRSIGITYDVVKDSFLTRVSGTIHDATTPSAPAFLLVDLPVTLESFEADSSADHTALSYAAKPLQKRAEGIPFGSLDPGERQIVTGPISWAVAKNKYFMLGLLARTGDSSFAEVIAVGGDRTSRTATRAHGTVVNKLPADGAFAFELYAGPQQYKRLQALGRDFENSNPYGGWMQAFVQPFATMVMKVLLWMKATLGLSYGWLLVLFGVAVRIILWPLNQSAMRATTKMQRIQPELSAIQTKFKGDPPRLQSEMMRVYKDHNMSPFSAFAGCLPLLIPMPVLFALFFVFQNTIEFRGVPFLWLADISLKDPFYIVPLLMGATMFVLSWVGMRNSPPNPQAKMMAYIMPVMMTVLFGNFASGLNLYYAVQNIAAIPQQWLISNERGRAADKAKA